MSFQFIKFIQKYLFNIFISTIFNILEVQIEVILNFKDFFIINEIKDEILKDSNILFFPIILIILENQVNFLTILKASRPDIFIEKLGKIIVI